MNSASNRIGRGARTIAAISACGTPRTRGRQIGLQLQDSIRSHVGAWLASLERAGVGEPRQYVTQLVRDTKFTTAIDHFSPSLLEEVEGVSEGCGIDRELLRAAIDGRRVVLPHAAQWSAASRQMLKRCDRKS